MTKQRRLLSESSKRINLPMATQVKVMLLALAVVVVAALLWTKFDVGSIQASNKDRSTPDGVNGLDSGKNSQAPFVELSEKQTGSLKIGPVELRNFEILKTAVSTIDFNEHMLVQVFSQYPGKILRAFFNLGDEVKQGDILFTIDSPALLPAESALLASAGVLELQTRTLPRATQLIKAGGSAQK